MKILKNANVTIKAINNFTDLGFVPTMGGLHKGHISLIRESQKKCKKTLVSIYINPKQFNNKSDFTNYPRNIKKDLNLLKKLRVNYVFIPNSKDTNSMKVFSDKFVVAHRANHDVSKIENLNLEEMLKLKYINISNRKRGASVVEMEMQKMQLQPEIALRAQHYLVTPEIVRSSDLCLLCAETFAKKHGLSYIELPFKVPALEQYLIWHNSDNNDGSHIWMRNLIAESFKEVGLTSS